MNPTFKAEARAAWHQQIQNRIGAPPEPVSEPMQRWRQLQVALALNGSQFHGAIESAYAVSPQAFAAIIAALKSGHAAAAGPHLRTPTFRGV